MTDRTYRAVNGVVRMMFRLLGVRFEIRGAHHIPSVGPAVLACNHIGYLDFTFVGLAASDSSRLVRFLAKRAIFDNPFAGPLMRRMRHISVDRSCGSVAYQHAVGALRRGEVVGVFPEATISRAWTLKPFKLGAATMAARENVPLIPIVTWGGHRIVTVDGRRSFRHGTPVTILVGAPIDLPAYAEIAEVNDELRRRMQALLEEAQRDYPEQPPSIEDSWWLPRHLGGSAPTPAQAAERDAAAVNRADKAATRRDTVVTAARGS